SVFLQLTIVTRNFFSNTMAVYTEFRRQLYRLYRDPVALHEFIWDLTTEPFVVNAFFVQTSNFMVFPDAFFRPPYYHQDAPPYITYATLASAVSHELFHAFELSGLKFNHEGKKDGDDSFLAMKERLNQVNNCYHESLVRDFQHVVKVQMSNVLLTINPNITTNENLADIFALRNSFWSYVTLREREQDKMSYTLPALNLTDEQLFFVASAQV
ncbi:Peptidase M13 C-terminal domain, partial [Trinorchestia longiramus]